VRSKTAHKISSPDPFACSWESPSDLTYFSLASMGSDSGIPVKKRKWIHPGNAGMDS
jgi:hypothetical protein